ncbi:hypothetical protein ACOSQ3_009430 [Xanthoceras sorbifolium]
MFHRIAAATPPRHSLLRNDSMHFSFVIFVKLIQNAAKSGSVIHGKLSHAHMIKTSFKPCLFLLNNLLSMRCKFGEMRLAYQLFGKMTEGDVLTYNFLVSGYTQHTFLGVITACSHGGLVEEGLRYFTSMHKDRMTTDVKLHACVVDILACAGRLSDAESSF